MKHLSKSIVKLTSSKGETMAESLISILVIALASLVFLNFVILSGRMMEKAKEEEKTARAVVAFLENMEEDSMEEEYVETRDSVELTVTVKSANGKTITREQFVVNVYDSPYGTVYR